jgi:hypothetical protein
MLNACMVACGCAASAANGEVQLPPEVTPLKPPVPTTPPVERLNVPAISLFGSSNSTSLTLLRNDRPPNEPVRVPE